MKKFYHFRGVKPLKYYAKNAALLFKNQLHPITIFSCFVLAISFFSLSIAGQIMIDDVYRYDYSLEETVFSFSNWSWEDFLGFCIFLSIGGFLMTAALGLMFHKRWARYLMQFGFIIAGISWLVVLSSNTFRFSNAPIIFTGITAAVLGLVVGALLFLNNTQWVLPYFHSYSQEDAGYAILDQEFTSPKDQHNA